MKKTFALAFTFLFMNVHAQMQDSKIFHISSTNTSFPDTARAKGHIYKSILYDAANHYSDSSVMIITPINLHAKRKVNLVFWFHGWNNNIDSAIIHYSLTRQFEEANTNSVLILAETAKNAPDSYGGKLEQKGTFKNLVDDVLLKLKKEKIIRHSCRPGNIVLAGHSGAYRVIANILQKGGIPVKETILFDALYAETDKFLNWINADISNRFINIYTDHGGTENETKEMLNKMTSRKLAFRISEESSLQPQQLYNNRILVIHSLREHDNIINDPNNFALFITNTPLLSKTKSTLIIRNKLQ